MRGALDTTLSSIQRVSVSFDELVEEDKNMDIDATALAMAQYGQDQDRLYQFDAVLDSIFQHGQNLAYSSSTKQEAEETLPTQNQDWEDWLQEESSYLTLYGSFKN